MTYKVSEIPFSFDDGSLFNNIENYVSGRITKEQLQNYITRMQDIINKVLNDKYGTVFFPDSFEREKIQGKEICHLLLNPSPNDRDIYLRIIILINRLSKFVSEDELDLDIYDSDNKFVSSSFINNRYCILISDRNVTSMNWWDDKKHAHANSTESITACFRKIIFTTKQSYREITKYSEKLWPNCYFHDDAKNFNKLGLPEVQYRDTVLSHLNYFNDYAQNDFTQGAETFQVLARNKKVDLSPESVNTQKAKRKMNSRYISVNKTNVLCDWHSKITRTSGRIHFHYGLHLPPDVTSTTKNKFIIGIYTTHLAT